ncbi:MAG: hypothetical protein PGN29_04630 [Gordonia paraffinivorans]
MTDSDGDHRLLDHLAHARAASGSPSLRAIADRTDYSHTTVAKAFTPAVTGLSWPVVEQVAGAVGADIAVARRLWDTHGPLAELARPRARSQWRMSVLVVWCGLLLSGGVAIAVMQSVDRDTARSTLITDLVLTVVAAGAAAAFATRALRAPQPRTRRYFLCLATGMAAWTVAQLLWFIERNIDDQALPSGYVHDAGWLLAPIAIGIGLHMRAGDYGLTLGYRAWQRIVALVCLAAAGYAAVTLLLVVVGFTVSGPVLVFLIYPAADLTLAVMAVVPLICGHRVIGSMLLVTAFFAAAASDIGYVMVRAEPASDGIPAPTALGYLAFAIVITIYSVIAQPLPVPPRPASRRWIPAVEVTAILDIATAGCALTAVGCGLVILWTHPDTVLAALAAAVVALAAGALATSTTLAALGSARRGRP